MHSGRNWFWQHNQFALEKEIINHILDFSTKKKKPYPGLKKKKNPCSCVEEIKNMKHSHTHVSVNIEKTWIRIISIPTSDYEIPIRNVYITQRFLLFIFLGSFEDLSLSNHMVELLQSNVWNSELLKKWANPFTFALFSLIEDVKFLQANQPKSYLLSAWVIFKKREFYFGNQLFSSFKHASWKLYICNDLMGRYSKENWCASKSYKQVQIINWLMIWCLKKWTNWWLTRLHVCRRGNKYK